MALERSMKLPARFQLIIMCFFAVVICYMDRVNISVTILEMVKEFGLNEKQKGWVLSSVYLGYVISMSIGGILADKYGGKIVLGWGLLLWSIFTMLTPFFAHHGFFFLILIRVLMGLGEGITFPAWHSMYARWIPFKERTRAIAITNAGIATGTIIALVGAVIIMNTYSWEWVFYSFGAIGIIWFFVWNKYVTSNPEDHLTISEEELHLIKKEAPASSKAEKLPFKKLATNLPFIAICVASFCNGWVLFFFISYLPSIIEADISMGGLGISVDSNIYILLITIPAIVGVVTLILGGILGDHLIKKGYKVINVRKSVNSIGFFGSAILLLIMSMQDTPVGLIICLCLVNTCSGICAGGFNVNQADIGPKYTGSLFGISGAMGILAAIINPIVAGIILDETNSYLLLYYINCIILLFGGFFYLFFASADKQFE